MLLKEKRTRNPHARLLGILIGETIANQSKIAELREAGRRLSLVHGLRSDPVRAKAAEVDAVFEREERIGALIRRIQNGTPSSS